jgi:hypothetical protein
VGFFSDLFEGNFGNLMHDITADPVAEIGLGTAAVLGTGGLLLPELLGAGGAGLAGSALAGAEAGGAAGAVGGLDLAGAGGLALGGLTGADSVLPANAQLASGNLTDLNIAGPGFNMPALDPNTGAPLSSPGIFDPGQAGAGGGWAGTMAPDAAGATPAGGATPGANILSTLDASKDLASASGDAAGGGGGIVNSLTSQLTKNPIGIAAAGAGLGLNLLNNKSASTDPALEQQRQLANNAGSQALQMEKYLSTGTLPPGLQSSVDQAVAAAKARIIANHATQGQSTDPTQNSALAQELSNIDLQATAQIAQIATQLYTQGIAQSQIDATLLNQIYQADVAQNKAVGDALTNFAKALAPSTGVNLLKVG